MKKLVYTIDAEKNTAAQDSMMLPSITDGQRSDRALPALTK